MKKRALRTAVLCLLMALLLGLTPALAAKGSINAETLWLGGMGTQIFFDNVPDNAKVISVKSSKPSVLSADKWGSTIYDMAVFPEGIGKSKVTVKYKVGKKTYTISGTYTVKKFPTVFSTLKVNGKKIRSSDTKNLYFIENYKKTSATLTFKAKSPWKVLNADLHILETEKRSEVTSGKAFKIPKGKDAEVSIYLRNKKTGDDIRIAIDFRR